MKKRIYSLILCLSLIVSMLPLTIFSASAEDLVIDDASGSESAGIGGMGTGESELTIELSFDWDAGWAHVWPIDEYGYTLEDGYVDDYNAVISSGGAVAFQAEANPYYRFVGWYDQNGELLPGSTGATYFEFYGVDKSYQVTARFEDISKYNANHNHDDFEPWGNSAALPDTAGNYYLTTDVTISDFWEAPDGIVLCLNGYVIENTGSGGAVSVLEDTQVIVTDCNSTNQTHNFYQDGVGAWVLDKNNFFTDTPYTVTGGVITGLDRCMYVYDYGALHMFGGNAVGATGSRNGPGVSISDGGFFYMYGGTVQGNVNTNAGVGKEGVREFDGGGGIFVDIGARAYLLGDSLIANNTALYTNNGGGVYNYQGTVYFGDNVRIENNRGDNGATSNYQTFVYNGDSSAAYVYSPLTGAQIGVSVEAGGRFLFSWEDNCEQYMGNFFSDDVRNSVASEYFPNDPYEEFYGLILGAVTNDGYVVTAGTRGAGTATVGTEDGAKGVIVSKNKTATLTATPINDDYSFVGWYNLSGQLVSTNPKYRVSNVKKDQHFVAYFTTKSLPLEVEASGTIHVFNSGDTKNLNRYSGSYRYKNPAYSTLTNNGKYLYFDHSTSSYDQKGPVGLPFYISGTVLEKSIVTMRCYDVDEVYTGYWEPGPERDYVYLVDLTTHTQTQLGYLTGQNNTWTNTSFTIAPELLIEGHTYQLYLDDAIEGWVAWIDTASISIGTMESQAAVVEEITSASLSGAIDSNREVTGNLKVSLPATGIYDIEFKATHIAENNQLGSLFADDVEITAPEFNLPYNFALETGAAEGAYRIDVYIKDLSGNVIKTVSCTAGYAAFAVTYDANGGTNNLPEDTNSYGEGQTVTVLFDYTPSLISNNTSKARTARATAANGSVFTGWSTDPNAETPMYTEDGVNTFDIGSSDVTLYAVYHEHTPGEMQTENVNAPTCTVNGSHDEVYYCSDETCGEEISRLTVEDYATGHSYGEWITETPATDDTEGLQYKECSVCQDVVTEVIPANGHTYASEVIAPTCVEQGYTLHTCENEGCGDSYQTDYVDPLGHTEEIIPGNAPTCEEAGLTDGKICTVCNETLVEQSVIDALGHDNVVTTTSPTCIDDAQIITVCNRCGDTSIEDDEANPADPAYHQYVAVGDKEPSESDPTGYTTYKCSICGDTYTVSYEVSSDETHTHVYNETPDQSVEPNCTEDGYDVYLCIECGFVHRVPTGAPYGHEFGEIERVDATCTTPGYIYYECYYCYTPLEETIDATGHNHKIISTSGSCTESLTVTYECTECGDTYTETGEAQGHIYDSFVTEPTCTEEGYTTYVCTVCGDSYTDNNTEATGHVASDWITDEVTGERYKECTVCGAILETEGAYIITVISEGNGTVSGGGYAYSGGSVTIVAYPNEHFVFEGWYKDDVLVSEYEKFEVENITESATYTARFTKQIPVLVDEDGDLVLKANGYDIENVKYVYIGTEAQTVENWNEFMAAKDPESTLMFYEYVADETHWPQYQTGYYATYIRSVDGFRFYNVVYLNSVYSTPYISVEDKYFVMNSGNYTIENVKLAYIGEDYKNVTTWDQLMLNKVEGYGIEVYDNVEDGTRWIQYTAGYYACYIKTAEIGPIYNVVRMENPCVDPYISVSAENLVLNANGCTVENVKYVYIGEVDMSVTNWDEFMAAKDASSSIRYYSDVEDGMAWPQYKAGYYAYYIRTPEVGAVYGTVYLEFARKNPYIYAEGENLVLSAEGANIENVKYVYIGEEEQPVNNWDEMMAAKDPASKLNYYSDVADGTAWTQTKAGYYACYIKATDVGVVYSVVYLENPKLMPNISVNGSDLVLNAEGYAIENVKYVYIGETFIDVRNWNDMVAAKDPASKLNYYSDVADGTAWTQTKAGYYACYIKATGLDKIYSVVYLENPMLIPNISAENGNLMLVSAGYTVENVKFVYIGEEYKTVTNWNEFMAAKDADSELCYQSNPVDNTVWLQDKIGYYAFYIRTEELGVLYGVVYMGYSE